LTGNPDSPEAHQYLDYIKSLTREGFTGNIMSSFNVLLKDLSVKPLEQGSVQHLRTSAATGCTRTVLASVCLASPGSRTLPRTASGPALSEELENKELFD
jgi:hypothetical protein